MSNSKLITQRQLLLLIMGCQLRLGIYTLPNRLIAIAKGSAWLTLLAAGVLIWLSTGIMYVLQKRFPNLILYDTIYKVLGKWLGPLVTFGYICFFLIYGTSILMAFRDILHVWMLIETPEWVLSLILVIASYFLGTKPLPSIARFTTIVMSFSLLLFVIFVVLVLLNYSDHIVDPLRFLPFIQTDVKGFLAATHNGYIYMLGFHIIMFALPFVEKGKRSHFTIVTLGIVGTLVFYILFIGIITLYLGTMEVTLIEYPWLYLLKGTYWNMVDRMDLLFIPLWLGVIIISLGITLNMASKGVQKLWQAAPPKFVSLFLAVTFFLLTLLPLSRYNQQQFNLIFSFVSYAFVFALPLFLLLTAIIRKKQLS
ncbi:GerAB/ArcD/ProY family transporter [Paenibacillus sp. P36]|uniref:GerAB/ArcD/ProY family transporter n=1 Tax=Paenibacillus sp. P36 TaxID=3342538 RepID=UPI0038B27A45